MINRSSFDGVNSAIYEKLDYSVQDVADAAGAPIHAFRRQGRSDHEAHAHAIAVPPWYRGCLLCTWCEDCDPCQRVREVLYPVPLSIFSLPSAL